MKDGKPLMDFGGYPEIDSAGIGDFHILGERLRFVLFDWYKIDGLWQRRIVGMAKMPVSSIPATSVQHWQCVFGSPRPTEGEPMH